MTASVRSFQTFTPKPSKKKLCISLHMKTHARKIWTRIKQNKAYNLTGLHEAAAAWDCTTQKHSAA